MVNHFQLPIASLEASSQFVTVDCLMIEMITIIVSFLQDFHQLANYIRQQLMKDFSYTMSDFQVLLYLYKCDIVPMKVSACPTKSFQCQSSVLL